MNTILSEMEVFNKTTSLTDVTENSMCTSGEKETSPSCNITLVGNHLFLALGTQSTILITAFRTTKVKFFCVTR